MGTCQWEVEPGVQCDAEATTQVTIKDRVTSVKMPVCPVHKAAYNRKAAELRAG